MHCVRQLVLHTHTHTCQHTVHCKAAGVTHTHTHVNKIALCRQLVLHTHMSTQPHCVRQLVLTRWYNAESFYNVCANLANPHQFWSVATHMQEQAFA